MMDSKGIIGDAYSEDIQSGQTKDKSPIRMISVCEF